MVANHFEELDNVSLINLEWQVILIKCQDEQVRIGNQVTL